ncbi:hypothetical protein DRP44_03335 [candidate division TA06 bacterium]|jgi:hypothetical protein|uniref:Uncharacterized protein n=1 Tax=candidate division TA06 bacterium TaxID=2250710 RepID=A0A660S982_UNCT6|nr:MAG: hypothetical protein DRP44_03335 [candidate division TA06 bacterium]
MNFDKIRRFLQLLEEVQKNKATDIIEFELKETENLFALITLGEMVGYANPPVSITLSLIPYMEREVILMTNRAVDSNDKLSDIASIMEVE